MSQTAAARKPVDVDDVVRVVEAPSNLTIDLHPVVVNQKIVAQKQLEIARNWTGDALAPKMQYQMAKLAVAYGLDPFLGELVCLGNKPYPTAAAIQRKANEDDRFDGEQCRPATAEERTAFYFPFEPPADEHLWRCEVWMKGKSHSFIGWGRASARNVKMSTMQMWLQEMAQKRARSRTYRLAINIGIPTIEEMYEFEDGTVVEVDPSKRIEATATVEGALGPPATKVQLEMITAHILTEENGVAGIVTEGEWNGIVESWDGMSAVRAEKILQHFLGPKLDMKEGVFAERKSQNQ
jgi:hypothetical protein